MSCSKNEEPWLPEQQGTMIGFDDLKVGDTFQYSLFVGESYFDAGNPNFEYTEDYLNIEIVEKLSDGFKVKEWIDPSSNMFTSSENYYYNDMDAVYFNNWIIKNDKIVIESIIDEYLYSHLFIDGFKTIELPLYKFNGEEVEITSWKTDKGFSESNSDFFVTNFKLFDITYPHLNVVVRDEPMAYDGNGNTYIYSKEAGFVRAVTYSAWTGKGLGWDRVK
jgi:hypothetical protein